MIRYRPFLNTDPPALADIWRSQRGRRGLMQPMSATLLEQFVFGKPYFDRDGLIVAVEEDRPIGFVHAGFGPTDDHRELSLELGVTCMLLVQPHVQEAEITTGLLLRSEQYLRDRGAKVLYAGGISPLNPFYLGLYGGSELPGILDTDATMQAAFLSRGYREIDRSIVFHRDLSAFRPLVDRNQMQIRRRTQIEPVIDPPSRTWWEACTQGGFDRTRFNLTSRGSPDSSATVMFWNLEPLSTAWGVKAQGLIDLRVDQQHLREGLATYLLGEAFRQLQSEGVSLVEVQTMQNNLPAIGLYTKLGFEEVDRGKVFRKQS